MITETRTKIEETGDPVKHFIQSENKLFFIFKTSDFLHRTARAVANGLELKFQDQSYFYFSLNFYTGNCNLTFLEVSNDKNVTVKPSLEELPR